MHHGRIHPPERLDKHPVDRLGERAGRQQEHQEHDQRQQRTNNEWPECLEKRPAAFERRGATVFSLAPNQPSKQRAKRQQETNHFSGPGARDRHRESDKNKYQDHGHECGARPIASRHAISLRFKAGRHQCDAAAEQVEDTRQFEQERDSARHTGKNKPGRPAAFESAQSASAPNVAKNRLNDDGTDAG